MKPCVGMHMVGVLETIFTFPFSFLGSVGGGSDQLKPVGVNLVLMIYPLGLFSPSGPGLIPSLWSLARASG